MAEYSSLFAANKIVVTLRIESAARVNFIFFEFSDSESSASKLLCSCRPFSTFFITSQQIVINWSCGDSCCRNVCLSTVFDENESMEHTLEYFQAKHYRIFKVRDCADQWFEQNNPTVSNLYANCKALLPALCMHVCFVCDKTPNVLGFWAEHDGQIAYFSSAEQIREHLANMAFMDFSHYVPSSFTCSSYLMLEHAEFGLSHVRYADCNTESSCERMLVADFHYVAHNAEMMHRQECFSMTFEHFKARLLPAGEESNIWPNTVDYVWGMVVENSNSVFLQNGCYTVSSMVSHPAMQKQESVLMQMDFINMSRCMLIEGSQIWINITQQLYIELHRQAHKQGIKIMLPVTKELHDNMQGHR